MFSPLTAPETVDQLPAVRPRVAEALHQLAGAHRRGAREFTVHAQLRQTARGALHVGLPHDLRRERGVTAALRLRRSRRGGLRRLRRGDHRRRRSWDFGRFFRWRGRCRSTLRLRRTDFGLHWPFLHGRRDAPRLHARAAVHAAQLRRVVARLPRVPDGHVEAAVRPAHKAHQHRPAVAVDGQRRLRAGAPRPAHGKAVLRQARLQRRRGQCPGNDEQRDQKAYEHSFHACASPLS